MKSQSKATFGLATAAICGGFIVLAVLLPLLE